MIKSLSILAILAAWFAVSGFMFASGDNRGVSGPVHHAVPEDALDTLAGNMGAGTWQKLHDDVSQTRGIGSVLLAKTAANWLITNPDWTADWADLQWNQHDRSKIRAWGGGALVDKPGHTRFYIPAMGGHFDGLDNGVYSFDLLDAAHAINTGSREGTERQWVKAKEGALLVQVRTSGGSPNRPFNAKNPYDANEQAQGPVQWQVYDRDDPFGDDQCNVGPPSTHLYGGSIYIPQFDGILVYGHGRGGSSGAGPAGFWLFDIATQDWQLLPADRDLTPPYDCSGATAGDMLWSVLVSQTNDAGLILTGTDRVWFGNRYRSIRWRTDDVDWTVAPQAAPNGHAQRTGNLDYHTKAYANHVPANPRSIAGPYSGDLGAWIFLEDQNVASGDTGFALVWPQIDQDDVTNADMEFVDYANYIPNDGVNYSVDLTSGVYSSTHSKFFFIHNPILSDFKGQVYSFDPATGVWATYIDPVADPSNPSQAVDNGPGSGNGVYDRFAYMEDRNLFLLVYDGGAEGTGYVGQVYVLKGI